jgi:hypothetical protein
LGFGFGAGPEELGDREAFVVVGADDDGDVAGELARQELEGGGFGDEVAVYRGPPRRLRGDGGAGVEDLVQGRGTQAVERVRGGEAARGVEDVAVALHGVGAVGAHGVADADGPADHHGAAEERLVAAAVGVELVDDRVGARRLAPQRHLVRVAPEGGDVLLDPAQRVPLVL